MSKILRKYDMDLYPQLFDQMFRARAEVFHERLGWDITVSNGREIDHYDEMGNAIYIVTMEGSQVISGSLRLLPTTGPTMLRNEFMNLFDEPVDVKCPTVWECTRFCVHPNAVGSETQRQVSTRLLIGLCQLCLLSGVQQIIGVYERRMTRIYGRIGWVPTPLASACAGNLILGLWDASEQALSAMRDRLNCLQRDSKLIPA